MEHIYKKIALKYGVSVDEVKAEIQRAMELSQHGNSFRNNSQNPDDFIISIAKHINEKERK